MKPKEIKNVRSNTKRFVCTSIGLEGLIIEVNEEEISPYRYAPGKVIESTSRMYPIGFESDGWSLACFEEIV